ncbi:iron complex outermembrane recepter protein [Salegentibacter agarivorans]|uniref:Iron complex outermembrane recepter protein n=1 Tax=Salegentibacter agarivorans TaxID=345907 RepID=A0A1I2N4I1_9FLAO|nr:TonB-dependent receptor [Salegentibacter agarivorans]SFF98338.1 iron complex outermembrane recepter protein [Salegentibacter agarivorans]
MKSLLFSLLFIAVSPIIYAQNNFSGKVTNAETGEPVFSANVYFPELSKGAMTDLDGNFTVENIPNGKFKIIVSSVGFGTYSNELDFPETSTLSITLEKSAIEMEEVIVSTPFHQLQSENVMRVERENVAELNRKGAVTLSDGITQIAGVESLTTGVGIGKPVIRGLSSNRVLVYTQGVRLENQQYGDEHGLGISSKGIESVEIIKGPASLLYGSDAIGGVLYLNPERYAAANKTNAEADVNYFSNTQGYQGSVMAKTSGEKLKFLARGSYAAHSDYETGDGERVTNTRFNETDFKAGIGYQDAKFKTDLRYNFNKSNIGIPEEIGVQSTDKDPLLPYQEIDNHILSLENKLYFSNSSLDFKVGYQYNNRKEFEEHHHEGEHEEENAEEEHLEENEGTDHPALEMHLETLNYNLKYNLPRTGRFETILGVQGMHQTNTNYGEEILIPDATTTDFGFFATTHVHFDRWDFQGGLRFDTRSIDSKAVEAHEEEHIGDEHEGEEHEEEHDHDHETGEIAAINNSYKSINGALGAKYNVTENLSARLNLATGFRAPNLSELTSNGSHHGTNRYEVGDQNLENEQNFQVDLSLEWRNKHFEAFVNGFHNSISDYIYLQPTGELIDDNPVFEYTQNNAELYGGEVGVHIHPHPLDWLHLESSFETVTGKRRNGEYLPLIPANSLTNTLRLEFDNPEDKIYSKYSFLRLKNVFNQNNVDAFETRTGGYGLLGAGFGGQFAINSSEMRIGISANNILNKDYISHLSRLKPDGISNIGRNISVSVRWLL